MDDPDTVSVMDAINMCVTVVGYACDSARATQMLVNIFPKSNHFRISSLKIVTENLKISCTILVL